MRPASIFDRLSATEVRVGQLEALVRAQDDVIRDLLSVAGRAQNPPQAMEPMARNMALIAARVAADNGLTLAQIKARYRGFEITRPRQYAMMLMADAGHSYASIGRFFGFDHKSVAHGVKVARARMGALQ